MCGFTDKKFTKIRASVRNVGSTQTTRRIQRYAVDGALHYAQKLSKEFNVIAVAVSGETKSSCVISSYLMPKGANIFKQLCTKEDKLIDELIPWSDYIEHATYDPTVQRMRFDELMAFSRDLHDFMRDHAKLTESEKPLSARSQGSSPWQPFA